MKYPLFLGDQCTSVQSMIWQSYVKTCWPVRRWSLTNHVKRRDLLLAPCNILNRLISRFYHSSQLLLDNCRWLYYFSAGEQAILLLRKLTSVVQKNHVLHCCKLNYACKEDYKQLMSFLINSKPFKKSNTQILKLTPINSVEKDTVVERDNFFLIKWVDKDNY